MADVGQETFSDVGANARDMAGQIMADIEAGVPDAAPAPEPTDSDYGWDAPGAGRDAEAIELGFAEPEQVAQESESAGVTASSPGSGSSSPAPAPQLDPSQQFMAAMFQQMQQQQAARDAQFQALLQQLAPKQEAPPPDPFSDMPPELRKQVEANPELKAYSEWLAKKAQAPTEAYRTEMEKRIQEAAMQKEVARFGSEAESGARTILAEGFNFTKNPAAQQRITDAIRDWKLALSDAHGGSPAQYTAPLKAVINDLVNARIEHLNSQAKAKVGQRQPGGAVAPRPQATGTAMSQFQNKTPTDQEARAAGYKSAFEAALDGDRKVHQMWAKQARGR